MFNTSVRLLHPSGARVVRWATPLRRWAWIACLCAPLSSTAFSQQPSQSDSVLSTPTADMVNDELSPAAGRVEVKPVARDEEIRERIQNILSATDWFTEVQVRVEQGVVFLHGQVESAELKTWAGDLARKTQDVVAVANRMDVVEPLVWDFSQGWSRVTTLWRGSVRRLPIFVFGLLILAVSIGAAVFATRGAQRLLRQRIQARLLRNVIARSVGGLVVLGGFYLVLRVAGLAQLALTLIGGTGLLGLIVGIAFRDITENFLSSVFLSMQRPFETGDLVEITGVTGYVQRLNIRTTILMTLDGNLTQIPNASVYKSNICNYTTNANRRESFVVGIGYDDPIDAAQETARRVLVEHPAVLESPEPSVLVDGLGSATVNLRVYFWLDGRTHSWLKVRSSVIRLVKLAFQQAGISLPDEAREVVFPRGVPVTMLDSKPAAVRPSAPRARVEPDEPAERAEISTKAEGGLSSESTVIEEQAQQSELLQESENLLPKSPGAVRSVDAPTKAGAPGRISVTRD
mgnify:CR=1 FL=1